MLEIIVPEQEQWDELKEEFVKTPKTELRLEHSLISISKWESKWHKPFLGNDKKSAEETIDYIRCMCMTPNVAPNVFYALTKDNVTAINEYISDPMTATTISDDKSGKRNREIMTSEVIYSWMISLNIPPEYAKWHLNRLIMLIRVCNKHNAPPKKMSTNEILSRNRSINEARRAALHSKG